MNKNYLRQYIIPAIISGIVSLLVAIVSFSYQSYRNYKEEKEPIVITTDYTNPVSNNINSNKEFFFNLSLRNTTITKVYMKVNRFEKHEPIYHIDFNGKGGGFDASKYNIVNVELLENTNEYILLDIKNGINKFKKQSLPTYVNYHNNLSNEFFRVFLKSASHHITFNTSIFVEWTCLYDDISKKIHRSIIGPHSFTFLNPISVRKIIPQDCTNIFISGYTPYERSLRSYLSYSFRKWNHNANIIFLNDHDKEYIKFDDKIMLIKANMRENRNHFYFKKIALTK